MKEILLMINVSHKEQDLLNDTEIPNNFKDTFSK